MPNITKTKVKNPKTGRVTVTKTNERTGVTKTITRGGGKGRTVEYKEGMPKIYRDNPQWAEEDLKPAYKKGGAKLRKAQAGIATSTPSMNVASQAVKPKREPDTNIYGVKIPGSGLYKKGTVADYNKDRSNVIRLTPEQYAKNESRFYQKKGGATKMKSGGATKFGMLSVKAGVDKNPKATAADRIAGAKMNKKKMGSSTKAKKK